MPEQTDHQDTQTAQISGTVQIKPNGDRQTGADRGEEDEVPAQKSGRKFIVIAVVILLVILVFCLAIASAMGLRFDFSTWTLSWS